MHARHTTRSRFISLLCGAAITLLCAHAYAQDDEDASTQYKTVHPDALYGSSQSTLHPVKLPGVVLSVPKVDRRDEVDPLAIQGALFPTAHIPKKYRFVYRNHLVFGQQLSARVTDRVMVSGLLVVSPGSLGWNAGADIDRTWGANARVNMFERGDLSVSVQGGLMQQKGLYKLDTRVLSGQLSAMLDYKASDSLVFGAGVTGNMPFSLAWTQEDVSDCDRRGDYVDGSCIQYIDESEPLPVGGRFLMGWAGLTYYGAKHVMLKGEVFSGLRRGTVFGLEGALYNDESLDTQLARYRDTSRSFGPVAGAPLGLSVSAGYTYKRFAAQGTLIMLPGALPENDNRDSRSFAAGPHIFPMMTLGVAL